MSFETLKINPEDWLTEVAEIAPLENDNEYGTHPDIDDRIENAGNQMIDYSSDDRSDFVHYTEQDYANLQTAANMELSMVYLTEQRYPEAIYHSHALLQDYPNNAYLKKNFVYGIYGVSQYAQTKNLRKVISSDDWVQGECEKVHHMFDELSRKELVTLAGAHCWELHQQYPDDPKVELMARDAVEDVMLYAVDEEPDEFFKKAPLDTSVVNNATNFSRLAFANYMEDPTFQGVFGRWGEISKAKRPSRKRRRYQ